ncbi:tetratricopeptide repeat protein [Bacteroides sp. 519]|uniref:tetratricopeptide repeat protein n=1 Tax=Bacteroides sp. 519 TaxID=2302937 RepID=UPI0013D49EE9|nr:tetratricopeptide repeat protein [Bacteroides sp. 519]NDV60743.1 tetratricopeptide repeat protein [Bacteroides sp. 519]
MKRWIICFLMSSFLFPIFAQEEDYDLTLQKGIELSDQGHFEEALKCYQECLALYPEAIAPHYEMAQTYASMNQHDDSKKCIEKAFVAWANQEYTDKITFYLEALSVYITLIIAD